MEKSSRKIIQGQPKQDYNACLIEAVGKIRGINKSDAISVVTNYGSLKRAILDDGNNLESISGWGETKVKRFKAAINEPFIYNKKYPTEQSPSSEHHSTVSTPASESNIS
jgi:DNA excision repair protein ERCC-1